MIQTGQKWMRYLRAWVQGEKHPETPRDVFMNVHEYDRVRRVLLARCRNCDYVISRDERAVREIVFVCDDPKCACKRLYGAISHPVCFLCYDMFHALYRNLGMKDMNYFKAIDEKEKKENDDPKRRDRLGL
jgi:hypothetical protein